MLAAPVQAGLALLRRDLTLAMRRRSEMANPLLFFVIVISLFPLAIGASPAILQTIAPGIIWVAALLAALLSLDSIFRSDFEDGSLEQLLLSPHPVALLVLAKIVAHWLVSGLPLVLLAPLLGIVLHFPAAALDTLLLGLALGTPVLSLVGAIGVALTVGLRRGGLLLALLILPLYIPVLIFAAASAANAAAGVSPAAGLYLLAALLAFALTLGPLAAAAALRISID